MLETNAAGRRLLERPGSAIENETLVTLGLGTLELGAEQELQITGAGGSTLIVRASMMPVTDDSGAITGLLALVDDVTRAHEARVGIEHQTAILQSVLDQMIDAVMVIDESGNPLMLNPAADQLFGPYARGHDPSLPPILSGDGVTPVPADQMPGVRCLAGEPMSVMDVVVTHGAQPRVLHVTATGVRGMQDEILGAVMVARDVTEARRLERALKKSEQLYRSLIERLPNGAVFLVDEELNVAFADGPILRAGPDGDRRAQIVGRPVAELSSAENRVRIVKAYRAALAGKPQTVDVAFANRVFQTRITPLDPEEGGVRFAMALIIDITEQKKVEHALRQQSVFVALLRAVAVVANQAGSAHDAMRIYLELICEHTGWEAGCAFVREGGRITAPDIFYSSRESANPVGERLAAVNGSDDAGLMGRACGVGDTCWLEDAREDPIIGDLLRETSLTAAFAFPVFVRGSVAAVLTFFSARSGQPDDALREVMANVATQLGHVIERDRQEAAIRELAIVDELTGLYNRRGFLALAAQQLRLADRSKRGALVFFVDMDGMKVINDRFGHEDGDLALTDLTAVLRTCFRASDVIARLGGDEFVVFAPDANESDAKIVIDRLLHVIEGRNASGERRFQLGVSVGFCVYSPANPVSLEQLLASADSAMYHVKKAKRAAQGRT